MRAPWIGEVLRSAQLEVIEHGQPRGRGRDMAKVNGVVLHDTVTGPKSSDNSVADLLRDGRADLAGPLAQLGLDRQGRFWWIADGRCNHNGRGEWGNDAIGIEVFCAGGLKGQEEPYSEIQCRNAARGAAAILAHLDLGADRLKGHKETDPTRKIDPFGTDMNEMRDLVGAILAGGTINNEEDDMTREQADQLSNVERIALNNEKRLDVIEANVAEIEARQGQIKSRLDAVLEILRKDAPV